MAIDTRVYWLWLQDAIGVGAPQSDEILRRFKTAKAVYEAPDDTVWETLTSKQREALRDKNLTAASDYLRKVLKADAWLLTPDDVAYPSLLRAIYAPPLVLYGKGSCFSVELLPTIAVVGSRTASRNGVYVARRIAAGLAAAGVIVVSGGAEGIDDVALTAALDAGGTCISFQAWGIDVSYPRATAGTRERLIRSGGMLLTEFPPGSRAYPGNFHIRNRLISGISMGVFVPQAPEKSGALITARHARE